MITSNRAYPALTFVAMACFMCAAAAQARMTGVFEAEREQHGLFPAAIGEPAPACDLLDAMCGEKVPTSDEADDGIGGGRVFPLSQTSATSSPVSHLEDVGVIPPHPPRDALVVFLL